MADDATRLAQAMQENATTPQSVTTRDGSVTSHSLDAQIKYDRYLASKHAAGDAFSAMRPRKMIPPSSVGSRISGGP